MWRRRLLSMTLASVSIGAVAVLVHASPVPSLAAAVVDAPPDAAPPGPASPDAGPGAADAGVDVEAPDDAGSADEAADQEADAGPSVDQALLDEIERLRLLLEQQQLQQQEQPPPATREDVYLSQDPNQGAAPADIVVTKEVRAALQDDDDLSAQAHSRLYVTTTNGVILLQGEVPSERERSLVEDKVRALVGDRFYVTNALIVRDRGIE